MMVQRKLVLRKLPLFPDRSLAFVQKADSNNLTLHLSLNDFQGGIVLAAFSSAPSVCSSPNVASAREELS